MSSKSLVKRLDEHRRKLRQNRVTDNHKTMVMCNFAGGAFGKVFCENPEDQNESGFHNLLWLLAAAAVSSVVPPTFTEFNGGPGRFQLDLDWHLASNTPWDDKNILDVMHIVRDTLMETLPDLFSRPNDEPFLLALQPHTSPQFKHKHICPACGTVIGKGQGRQMDGSLVGSLQCPDCPLVFVESLTLDGYYEVYAVFCGFSNSSSAYEELDDMSHERFAHILMKQEGYWPTLRNAQKDPSNKQYTLTVERLHSVLDEYPKACKRSTKVKHGIHFRACAPPSGWPAVDAWYIGNSSTTGPVGLDEWTDRRIPPSAYAPVLAIEDRCDLRRLVIKKFTAWLEEKRSEGIELVPLLDGKRDELTDIIDGVTTTKGNQLRFPYCTKMTACSDCHGVIKNCKECHGKKVPQELTHAYHITHVMLRDGALSTSLLAELSPHLPQFNGGRFKMSRLTTESVYKSIVMSTSRPGPSEPLLRVPPGSLPVDLPCMKKRKASDEPADYQRLCRYQKYRGAAFKARKEHDKQARREIQVPDNILQQTETWLRNRTMTVLVNDEIKEYERPFQKIQIRRMYVAVSGSKNSVDENTKEIRAGTLVIIPNEATQGSNFCFNLAHQRHHTSYHGQALVQNSLTVRRHVKKRSKGQPNTAVYARCLVCSMKDPIKTPLSLPQHIYNAVFRVRHTHRPVLPASGSQHDIMRNMRASLFD